MQLGTAGSAINSECACLWGIRVLVEIEIRNPDANVSTALNLLLCYRYTCGPPLAKCRRLRRRSGCSLPFARLGQESPGATDRSWYRRTTCRRHSGSAAQSGAYDVGWMHRVSSL